MTAALYGYQDGEGGNEGGRFARMRVICVRRYLRPLLILNGISMGRLHPALR